MFLQQLVKTGKTVFSSEDLGKIFEIDNKNYLKVVLSRLTKRGELIRLRKGIFIIREDYNRYELANKLKRPSYVSLERILFENDIIFQDYSNAITSVSNNSYKEQIAGFDYSYYKIKDEILTNPIGIEIKNNYAVATTERASCDLIYLMKNFYFDNIDHINKDLLKEISKIYNKRVIREVEKICSTQKNMEK
ncbi:hypothetical protein A2954_02670 [Candidatus Roizmanbacteria bacterium RIFCSPLOWO2_01_FULL_37_12]|uniref:AbiEi antitoxin N-terminal domain-containing protein n=1 Tax=Candidatus Roizmanbacteria bacterium RIFCSPLOWO2_01_FULL_37_12 TaxID=1802056 RepID=A0A1F7IEZ0_9BACT|nr:MAG: hypothetical protein A2767_02195 [Candidatus Roizmanbacteria bacterium RIFCSPHIGHO2_01_FULL_35_10]OGK41928.1 MAG: hypothetical protein A2954_02670 [Candidatus Roizmanbacteria bacterium RIFCSPLOWO2_01_FULL_37_12]